MAEKPREVLVPVEQATITLYGQEIIAVRLPDGRIAAVLSTMCAALQIATESQARRIRLDDVLADQLLLVQIATAGGPQPMDALTAWAIPSWLTGTQIKRLAPEKRPAVLAFKREAADVLYRHFARKQSPALPAPQESVAVDPATDALVVSLAEQIEAQQGVLTLMREHLAALLSLPGQVEALSEQMGHVAAIVEALAERQSTTEAQVAQLEVRTDHLTPAHAHQVQDLVNRLVRETKRLPSPLTHAIIYGRIRHYFRVNSYYYSSRCGRMNGCREGGTHPNDSYHILSA